MGLRASRGPARRRGLPRTPTLVIVALLLAFSSCSEGNRLPKFPNALKLRQTKEDAVETTSTESSKSEAEGSGSANALQQLALPGNSAAKDVTSPLRAGQNRTKAEEAKPEIGDIFTSDQQMQDQWKAATAGKDSSPSDENSSAKPKSSPSAKDSNTGLNSTVMVKARLKPNDVLGKGGKKKDPHAKLLTNGKHSTEYNYTAKRAARNGILDVVITHYDLDKTEETVNYWLNFLQLEKVQKYKPYVFIYCQNDKYDLDEDDFRPILQLGGEIQHLPNIGRESHAYLTHILSHYGDLANYTLFAQDASDPQLPERFEMLFDLGKTGFLPLSLVGHVDCDDPFLPHGVIPQLYAMFANELCPPVGYTSSFQGQFLVSKTRIQKNSWWTYQRLQDVLSADEHHWIHQTHENAHYKTRDNPLFGHVLERTWSVAFDCFESWREGNCWQCIVAKGMQDCGPGDCQCFDSNP